MPSIWKSARFLAAFAFSLFLLPVLAFGQYVRHDLVTDSTDPNLVNGWGLTRSSGSPFCTPSMVPGLAIQFGNAANAGKSKQLFFTAGPNNYANGLFGMITFSGE